MFPSTTPSLLLICGLLILALSASCHSLASTVAVPAVHLVDTVEKVQEIHMIGPLFGSNVHLLVYRSPESSTEFSFSLWTIVGQTVTRKVGEETLVLPCGASVAVFDHDSPAFFGSNLLNAYRIVVNSGVYYGETHRFSTDLTLLDYSQDGANVQVTQNQAPGSGDVLRRFKATSYSFQAGIDAKIDLFGGKTGSTDTFLLSDNTTSDEITRLTITQSSGTFTPSWTSVENDPIYSRFNHSMVYVPAKNLLYIFGGVAPVGDLLVTLASFISIQPEANTFDEIAVGSISPQPRQGHSMVYIDTIYNSVSFTLISPSGKAFIFVFGGKYGNGSLVEAGDDWGYDIQQGKWFRIQIQDSIARRTFHGMNAAIDGPYAILFGGLDEYDTALEGQIHSINFQLNPAPPTDDASTPVIIPEALTPTAQPIAPIAPIAPTTIETGCPLPQPTNFVCADGTWTSISTVHEPTITIPNAPVVIIGDLDVPALTFGGLGSSVQVFNGCATIGSITITLTEEEIGSLEKSSRQSSGRQFALISQPSNCTTFASGIPVSVKALDNSCKKVSAKSVADASTGQLSAIFSVDSSWCSNRWIILGCVLGGVLIIILILALVFTRSKKARECIRPYSKRGEVQEGA